MKTCPKCGSVAIIYDKLFECERCRYVAPKFPNLSEQSTSFRYDHGQAFVAVGEHGFYGAGYWHRALPACE
jgi:hypothetical protein